MLVDFLTLETGFKIIKFRVYWNVVSVDIKGRNNKNKKCVFIKRRSRVDVKPPASKQAEIFQNVVARLESATVAAQ